jgi:hypothetical protein
MLFGGAADVMLLGTQRLRIGERPICPHFRRMRRLFRILGLQPGVFQHPTKRSLATRSALGIDDVSIPIDDYIDGIELAAYMAARLVSPVNTIRTYAMFLQIPSTFFLIRQHPRRAPQVPCRQPVVMSFTSDSSLQ